MSIFSFEEQSKGSVFKSGIFSNHIHGEYGICCLVFIISNQAIELFSN